jgi:hypothetical protein
MKQLVIKENKSYTECKQNVSKVDAQIRLDKVSIDYTPMFEQFWKAWLKKTDKKLAEKRLTDILKKEKDPKAKFVAIMDGVKRYNKHLIDSQTETRFYKNPASWLLNEKWQDEYETKTTHNPYPVLK